MSRVGNADLRLKKAAFVEAFAEIGVVSYAADVAGIHRTTHWGWLKADSEYAEAFKAAEQHAIDALEVEARRRAVEGVEEPVGWHKGTAGGTVTKYSDTLLIFLLKARRPKQFRDRYEHAEDDTRPEDFARAAVAAIQAMEAQTASES